MTGILLASYILAHHFYHYECCSDRDCFPVPFEEVQQTPKGYRIKRTGQMLFYGDTRIKPTPPEDAQQRYHVCTTSGKLDGSMILCLYAPQGGA